MKKFISIHDKQQIFATIRIIVHVRCNHENMHVRQQKNNENRIFSHVSQQKFDFVKNANRERQNYQYSQHV